MKKSRSSSRKKKSRKKLGKKVFQATGLSVKTLSILLLLTVGILSFIGIQYFFRSDDSRPTEIVSGPKKTVVEASVQSIVETNSSEKVIELARKLPTAFKTLDLPVRMLELQFRIDLLKELKQKELEPMLLSQANQLLAQYYFEHDNIYLDSGIDRSMSKPTLLKFANELIDSNDRFAANTARTVLMKSSLAELLKEPTAENFAIAENMLKLHSEGGLERPQMARKFVELLINTAKQLRHSPEIVSLQRGYGDKMLASSENEKQKLGQRLHDAVLLKGINTKSLRIDLALGVHESEMKYKQVLDSLASNANLGQETYSEIFAATESLATIDRMDDVTSIITFLQKASAEIKDDSTREFVKTELELQTQRMQMIGKQLDISGTTYDGQPILSDKHTVIVLWSSQDADSSKSILKLTNAHPESSKAKFQFIAACQEKLLEEGKARIPEFKTAIVFASDDTSAGIFAKVPVGSIPLPYAMIVDPSGTVVAINVPLYSVTRRMKALIE